jgi:DNA-binding GntR family transcriptional regulator
VNGKQSQADMIYEDLRERLTRGEIPFDRKLIEQQLAADFQTSRTPVREALRRLEGDGHLTRDPSGGMRPRVPSVSGMRDLYDVRIAIEDLIVRRASSSGDRGALEGLQQEWLELSAEHRRGWLADAGVAFVRRDESFHERLADSTANEFALKVLRDINARIRILRIHDFTTSERIGATIGEHLEIIRAILAGEAETAAGFMRAHVERSANVVRERIGDALTRMFEAGETRGTTPRSR